MKLCRVSFRFGWRILAACALSLSFAALLQAQGGGIPGIILPRAPNPTAKKPPAKPPAPPKRPTGKAPRPPAKPPALSVDESVEAALDKGNEARDARRFTEAEREYRSALRLRKSEWRAAYGLGNVYADQQLWDEAEKAYHQAAEYNPQNVAIFLALGSVLLQPRPRGNDANLLINAEFAARRALRLDAESAAANDLLGLSLVQRGIFNDEAEGAFRRALAKDPDKATPYVHLARFLVNKSRNQEAEGMYQKAISLAGGSDPEAAIPVASELQREQRWEDSSRLLETALNKDPDNPTALVLLARALSALNRLDEAVARLETAIGKIGNTFQPRYLLGYVYLRQSRLAEAEKQFNEAFKYADANEKTLLGGRYGYAGIGEGYERDGQFANALRAYERGLACDPKSEELQKKVAEARKKARGGE
jgi:cytochrome c-type biogenesis protein CcmH/NrfG